MSLRIAFCGASGTGKSTLAQHLVDTRGLPLNPVGSRSVSLAMGFDSPYDVDKAGKRAEFQRRLLAEKRSWEDANEDFVTDRTTLDNLAYTMLHDVHSIDDEMLEIAIAGTRRYTHLIYCPVSVFCDPAGDKDRVQDMTYHRLYEALLIGLVNRWTTGSNLFMLHFKDIEERKAILAKWIDG